MAMDPISMAVSLVHINGREGKPYECKVYNRSQSFGLLPVEIIAHKCHFWVGSFLGPTFSKSGLPTISGKICFWRSGPLSGCGEKAVEEEEKSCLLCQQKHILLLIKPRIGPVNGVATAVPGDCWVEKVS